jgi:hypothetical protein
VLARNNQIEAVRPPRARSGRKAFWLKQLHSWHWISSAISLIGLLLFAVTGFTLNHTKIEASPTTIQRDVQLPPPLARSLAPDGAPDANKPLPPPVSAFLRERLPTRAEGNAEWSASEIYLALPRPGGDGWLSIDRATGKVSSEFTDRGWIAYLNDLHKGRNSGAVWKWFIDIFAGACLVFSLTGLVLLWLHARRRPSTWPLVGMGLAIPAAIAVFFIHV